MAKVLARSARPQVDRCRRLNDASIYVLLRVQRELT
jgi:hypothetical protein